MVAAQIVLVFVSVAVVELSIVGSKVALHHCTVHRSISMTMAVPGQTPTPIVCLLAGRRVGRGSGILFR